MTNEISQGWPKDVWDDFKQGIGMDEPVVRAYPVVAIPSANGRVEQAEFEMFRIFHALQTHEGKGTTFLE